MQVTEGRRQGNYEGRALWRMIEFPTIPFILQQFGARTAPKGRPKPWMAVVDRLRNLYQTIRDSVEIHRPEH